MEHQPEMVLKMVLIAIIRSSHAHLLYRTALLRKYVTLAGELVFSKGAAFNFKEDSNAGFAILKKRNEGLTEK